MTEHPTAPERMTLTLGGKDGCRIGFPAPGWAKPEVLNGPEIEVEYTRSDLSDTEGLRELADALFGELQAEGHLTGDEEECRICEAAHALRSALTQDQDAGEGER